MPLDETPSSEAQPVKRGRGNPNWTKGQPSANPGGVVDPGRKLVRRSLLQLVEAKAGSKLPKPKTRADEIALELWNRAMGKEQEPVDPNATVKETKAAQRQNEHGRFNALVHLIEKIDGRVAPSKEETDAIASSGNKVIVIDSSLRPKPRTKDE